ncbi:MAG: hypothetical protein MUE91_03185 [Ignavibacteriaceae bacterium]|jgi:hypothetical protein|nr:hypothetical protein [Ignavibacteriaceae bacterium]
MKKSVFLILIIEILFLISCNNKAPYGKLDFPITLQQQIKSQKTKGKIVVYYHSGECSICFGTLLAISNDFPDLPIISVSGTKNAALVNSYLGQMGFKGISLIDSTSLFLKSNQKVLNTQNLFLIDSQYKIIVAGKNLDESIKRKINRILTH